MNVYLIGMMGSGKTSTGQALARLLKMNFLDLDAEIESEAHLSVNEIFEKRGEAYFRALESKILRDVSYEKNTVVATGGGVVLNPKNVSILQRTGRVIYLSGAFETLWERVRDKKDRPLLKTGDPRTMFYQLFQERCPLYETACEKEFPTDSLNPETVARRIAEQFA